MVRPAHVFAAIGVFVGVAIGACGSNDASTSDGSDAGGAADSDLFVDGSTGSPNDTKRIYFEPTPQTVTVDGTGPKSASFTLKAERNDGTIADVTAESVQFDRPDLAKVTPGEPVVATASGPFGGVGRIHAIYKGLEAIAELDITVKSEFIDPSADPAAVTALRGSPLGADPALTSLLYPYDKTVFPLGLTSPLVMWDAPTANDTYRVHLEEDHYVFDGFYKVGGLGQQRVDQAVWDRVTTSNGGSPLKLTLSRFDAASSTAYESAHEAWTIAPASVRGAIYYWTTSNNGHLSKIQPGTGSAPVSLYNGTCMGCHAVSADGNTLVATVENGQAVYRSWVSFDLTGPTATVRKDGAQFGANLAVNPDGKYIVYGAAPMHLGDTTTGAEIANSNLETTPLDQGMNTLAHPAFSPDGKKFAAIQSSADWISWQNSKLTVMDFDEASQKFSNPTGLAASASFDANQHAIAYPSFTPDSQSLAFHVSDFGTECNANACDANATGIGSIWMQSVTNSAPLKLAALNDSSLKATDHNVSFEPTFNPVERGGYFWVVFTSMRDWGNKPEVSGTANNGKKRLWIAAIDKTTGAADPSHPAFFLEGQELSTTNMRGFWALASCKATGSGGTCSAGFECCSGFCDQGMCIDVSQVSCKASGEACTATADCCNAPAIECTDGVCKSPLR